MDIIVRPARPLDALAIRDIGICYYLENCRETLHTLAPKIAAGYCQVAEIGSYVVGYLLAVPAEARALPLGTCAYSQPKKPTCLYLNTLCVAVRFQGLGVGSQLVARAVQSSPYNILSVLALNNSERFWAKQGFQPLRELNYFNQRGVHMELVK